MQTIINAKFLSVIAAMLAALLSIAVWQQKRAVAIDNRVKVDHAAALDKYAAERERMEKQMRIADGVTNYRSR